MNTLTTGATKTIKLPYPHPGQQVVLRQAKRFNWLAAGRRWRKTTLGLHPIIEGMISGGTYIWGAPTYDQVRIAYNEAIQAMGGIAVFNASRMMAHIPLSGTCYFRSLDQPDNVRGYTADGVVMDEAGYIKAAVYHEILRPMLIDTGGWFWAKGTPNGRNWFWQEWQAAGDKADNMRWQIPTRGVRFTEHGIEHEPHPLENPNIPFEEIINTWRSTPEYIFRQEYLAEFIESGGGVFRRVMEAATATELDKAQDGRQYVAGVDVASKVDFTAVSVFDVEARAQVYLDRFNRVEYPVLEDMLHAVYQRFNLTAMTIEDNSIGQGVIDHLRQRGMTIIPFTTTNTTKQAIIQQLASAFEHGEIKILNDSIQVGELQAFEGKRLAGGGFRYEAPEGLHDDTVMAMAICWQGLGNRFSVLWEA